MDGEITDLKKYPTTRYQGSKRKLIPWIFEVLHELEFNTVLDACGGSASVSYLFKRMNKSVTYNDNLKFNYIIGKALIENHNVKFSDDDINNLVSSNIENPELVSRLFKGVYYLGKENKWLDKVGYGILNMNHYVGQELDYKKSLAYYALFQASLTKRPFNLFHRNNLNIRTADVPRNFGNKNTWEKKFETTFKHFVHEVNSMIFNSNTPCVSLNQSVFEIENTDYDLVYIDPPYLNKEGNNETSNYYNCYHFLEGMVNYNQWENLIDFDTRNLRLKQLENSVGFNKDNIYTAFETLIAKFAKSKLVISYKKGGLPSIEFIIKTMKKHKNKVYTRSQHYGYALNRQNGDAQKNREVLIIGI